MLHMQEPVGIVVEVGGCKVIRSSLFDYERWVLSFLLWTVSWSYKKEIRNLGAPCTRSLGWPLNYAVQRPLVPQAL